jgi:hypothetical protein
MILKAPTYRVNLKQPPSRRWNAMLHDPWVPVTARNLCESIRNDFDEMVKECVPYAEKFPSITKSLFTFISLVTRAISGGSMGDLEYRQDMEVWAKKKAVGDLDQVLIANFSYELYQTYCGLQRLKPLQLLKRLKHTLGFCTSVAFHHRKLGMVHCRNVDWPVGLIRTSTAVLEYPSPVGPFKAVSVPGMVGVLSGVAQGRFSITVNSKKDSNHFVPNVKGWGALLLTRWILENCATWEEALTELLSAPAFVPFFVMLVGCVLGEAVVVEVNTSGKNRVYHAGASPLALANHHPGDPEPEPIQRAHCWDGYDEEEFDWWTNSQRRQELIGTCAGGIPPRTNKLRSCFRALEQTPVENDNTVQSMVLHPVSGEVLLRRC